MKKIMCLLLLILLALVSVIYSDKDIKELFLDAQNIKSIKVILNDNLDKYEGVFNGDKKIVDIKSIDELHTLEAVGVTIILNKDNFDLYTLCVNYNISIVKKYRINDNMVYDCKISNCTINKFSTMQIVIKEREVVIGFPMILNSF